MAETRYINDEYNEIAEDVINEFPELEYLRGGDIQIIVLSIDATPKQNGRIVHGVCEKVPSKNKWAIPCDFTIAIYDANNVEFSDEQLRILIFHELLHVGVDGDKLYVKKHDVEDFAPIIDRYGAHWSEPGWTQLSLEDL